MSKNAELRICLVESFHKGTFWQGCFSRNNALAKSSMKWDLLAFFRSGSALEFNASDIFLKALQAILEKHAWIYHQWSTFLFQNLHLSYKTNCTFHFYRKFWHFCTFILQSITFLSILTSVFLGWKSRVDWDFGWPEAKWRNRRREASLPICCSKLKNHISPIQRCCQRLIRYNFSKALL